MDPQHKRLIVVGMGELAVTADAERCLATYALGSCIGIAAYDPRARVGGLLHFMLPDSSLNPGKALAQPGAFCDTGLARLLDRLTALGAAPRRLRIVLAGAAKVLDAGDFFDVGRRNALAAKRRLWELGLLPDDEACGGELSRTLKLDLATGKMTVRDLFGERELGIQGGK
jgi:chemotaxis protein CheD